MKEVSSLATGLLARCRELTGTALRWRSAPRGEWLREVSFVRCGPEQHACGVRSETALPLTRHLGGGVVEWGGWLTGVKLCALIDGSGVVA